MYIGRREKQFKQDRVPFSVGAVLNRLVLNCTVPTLKGIFYGVVAE